MAETLDTRYPTAISPNKFAHFVVKTTNLERTRDWYLTVLNASVAFENHMCAFITYDEEHHRIGIIKVGGLKQCDPRAEGLEHVAFTYDELGMLLATYRRLRAVSITPYWSVIHGPTVSIYYKDPTGIKVELQYDVFKTNDEIDTFFRSGAYEENFVGVAFDPDEMAHRFENGTPVSELVKRPQIPPGTDPWSLAPSP